MTSRREMRRLLAEAELARRLGEVRTSAGRGGVSLGPRRGRLRAGLERAVDGHYKSAPPADPVYLAKDRVARMERRT